MALFPPYSGPPLIAQICGVENLTRAWRRVRANIATYMRDRSAGIDAVTLRDFEANWSSQMAQLSDELRSGAYRPLPPRRVNIPKPSGGQRAIAILAVRDRIAQRAVQQVIEPLFDPYLLDCSFGCRPRLGVADAIERVNRYAAQGFTWVVDADVATYFDSLDQRMVLGFFRQRVSEIAVLRLIAQWLASGAHQVAEASPLTDAVEGSLLQRGADWLRQAAGRAGELHAGPGLGEPYDPYAAARWERSGGDGWNNPYTGLDLPPSYGPAPSRPALVNTLWSAYLLARPALATSRRALPYLARLGPGRLALAGGLAAGTIAAAELVSRWRNSAARGTIQGGPLSPLLANIYLHPFDLALTSQGLRLVRFMDDFVVLCPSREEAERALRLAEQQLAILRLQLNPAKTSIRDYNAGIDFLGQALAPKRKGPTLEQGLQSFEEADKALRAAMQQARTGARKAGTAIQQRYRNGKARMARPKTPKKGEG